MLLEKNVQGGWSEQRGNMFKRLKKRVAEQYHTCGTIARNGSYVGERASEVAGFVYVQRK
jgi:hypothetical protein